MTFPVMCGIDRIEQEGFAALQGRHIGLITNHTGLNRDGKATADLLHAAPGLSLEALFGPEHGIRGDRDEKIADAKDAATGLPVYSLYGTHTQPTPEQLNGLDTLVFDIQDIGTRFYTYISTLGLCMEVAAKQGLRFVVLDRPNPIGGVAVEGPVADADQLSFTAHHPIPIRHGLTIGEMARLFQQEKPLTTLDLQVIPVTGWRRADLWDATNLVWVNPSPNMRSLTQALLYPGIGLLEFTNLSVGRGTDTPFEVIGAPWLDGRRLAAALHERNLPGVRFIPLYYTPRASVHQGQRCGGVQIVLTVRSQFVPVYTGLVIAETLHRLYPQAWEMARYRVLLAHQATFEALQSGVSAEAIVRTWQPQREAFRKRRRPSLLYT